MKAFKAVFEWIARLPEMTMSHEDGILVIAAICTIVVTVLGNGYFIRLLWHWWKRHRVNNILRLCLRLSNDISKTLEYVDNAKPIETQYQLLKCAAKKICESQSDPNKIGENQNESKKNEESQSDSDQSSWQHSDCKKKFWEYLADQVHKTDYKGVFKRLKDRVCGFFSEKTENDFLIPYSDCLIDQLYRSYRKNKYIKQIVIGKALRELKESKDIFKSEFDRMIKETINPLRDQKKRTVNDQALKGLEEKLNDKYDEFKKKVVRHLEETQDKVVEIHRDILLNL